MSLRPDALPPAPADACGSVRTGSGIRADIPMTGVTPQEFLDALRRNVAHNKANAVPGVPIPEPVQGVPVSMEQDGQGPPTKYMFRICFVQPPTDPGTMIIRIYDIVNEAKEQEIAKVISTRIPGSAYRVAGSGHLKVCAHVADSYFYINLKHLSHSANSQSYLQPSMMANHFFMSDNRIVIENGKMKGTYYGRKPSAGMAEYHFYSY